MKINYCLPIIKSDKEEILKIIEENNNTYQYFEVWLESIDNPGNDFLEKIISTLGDKLILLFSRENMVEKKLSNARKEEIVAFVKNRCLIDLDVVSDKEVLKFIQKTNLEVKAIVSHHNYQETPQTDKLKEIIDTIKMYNPEIIKLSTMCKAPDDALRLLETLLKLKSQDVRSVILGMGKEGAITRVFGTLFGNELIYAPQTVDEQSAAGQLTKQQLETIFKELLK